ncbi:hypothetical protein FRZ44_18010 [Hypericibacter terrae]|uniref:Uncharacterized protein n=1 Tax=Hypericibacter terrae TaxID=2602015 RepID=A0A5J6MNZ8_9PROT|nr:hypothetical protein [Hypericibacter terrae]QEX16506.1 hypothetical protein FRZ44_18010 [Hypericibacter terrae]
MFHFLRLFADPINGLREQISDRWSDIDVVPIECPFSAVAVRFGLSHYDPEDEAIPEPVSSGVNKFSEQNPSARFLLLQTICWGGDCFNSGHVVKNGEITCHEEGEGALRRLVSHMGADLGPLETFEPLRRGFPWTA